MAALYVKRGTRTQVNTAKADSQLAAGELYLLTDESRLAAGTAANAYQDYAKTEEAISIPQNAKTGDYTLVLADSGKHIYHASAAAAATYTIPANSSVAYAVGTTISFVNLSANNVTLAITSDTLYLAGTGATGNRTLAQYGMATALKITSTAWIISGTGLT